MPARSASTPLRTIGLMSGTSLDGVDGVLVQWDSPDTLTVLADVALPIAAPLQQEFLALNSPGENELHRAALAANALARLYAQAVQALLSRACLAPQDIAAVGAHGQTVRHRPQEFDGTGYTLQLNNPALLAELTGIAVVADLRSRDVAAGGQGAPLVPAFHAHFLNPRQQRMALLNLGGIGNLTLLQPHSIPEVSGFDCGPGNVLLDHWCQRHQHQAYDRDGAWASTGTVHQPLLDALLREPYLLTPPPKSTGRDLFHGQWLQAHLNVLPEAPLPQDVQATLSMFTAHCAALALHRHLPDCLRLLLCGGGAYNRTLVDQLQALLPQCKIESTMSVGLPPTQVEACAFAWLALCWLNKASANLPEVTAAKGTRILGALYPA